MRKRFGRLLSATLVALVELWLRLRSYGSASRARRGELDLKIQTIRPLQPGKFLIFACYPSTLIEPSLLRVLDAFASAGVQLVVVSTAKLLPETVDSFAGIASSIIEMPNVGRDFGAYQQGVFHLEQVLGLSAVTRLVFLNDSIYFFRNAPVDELVSAMLEEEYAYVGTNENFNSHYHVGSFFFAISGAVAGAPKFKQYWKRYLPLSTRRHSIAAGEVGITKTIVAAGGGVPRIVFQLGDLADEIIALVRRRVGSEDHLLSIPSRRHVLADAGRFASIAEISHDDVDAGLAFADLSSSREADRLMEYLQNHNQVHNLALLFAKYSGMPFIKKDVVYRGVFLVSDVIRFCLSEGLDDVETLSAMFRPRKTPATVIGFRQLWLSRHGFI